MDYAAIWQEGEDAALKAMKDFSAKCTRDVKNGMYDGGSCGMAWIVIRPARGKFVSWCKAQNEIETARMTAEKGRTWPCHPKGDNHYAGGWCLWRPGSKHYHGQSIDMYEIAAKAFSDVLARHGIVNTVGSRLD